MIKMIKTERGITQKYIGLHDDQIDFFEKNFINFQKFIREAVDEKIQNWKGVDSNE